MFSYLGFLNGAVVVDKYLQEKNQRNIYYDGETIRH